MAGRSERNLREGEVGVVDEVVEDVVGGDEVGEVVRGAEVLGNLTSPPPCTTDP